MRFQFKKLEDLKDLKGKTVLVRADFNLAISDGVIQSDYKIVHCLPTIEYVFSKGGKAIVISHIKNKEGSTLKPVAEYLSKKFPVFFVSSLEEAEKVRRQMKVGELILLENIRNFSGEEKNDPKFSKELANLADIFVNEAFPSSHRKHASIIGLPKLLPSFAGFRFNREVDELSRAFSPERPYIAIIGGVKAETKIPILKEFIVNADEVFMGGALANDFLRAEGRSVGRSVFSEGLILEQALSSEKIILPEDVLVEDEFGNLAEKAVSAVLAGDSVVDIGPRAVARIAENVAKSKFIIWNGPLGWNERGFTEGSSKVAKAISRSGAYSILGGGDTIATLEKLGLSGGFSFISTGGGAMLDFIAERTLPGIKALEGSV